jgi:hypothetical protein
LLSLRNICFFLLAATGVVINLRSLRNESLTAVADRLLLLLPALFLLVVFLFLEAAPYPQSALLFAPLLAIYGAEALQKAVDGFMNQHQRTSEGGWMGISVKARNLLFVSAAVAAGLVIPGTMLLLKGHPFRRTNAQQFQRMDYVLRITRPTDVVFDGQSAYVFRPQAYFYSSLFRAIEGRIQRGEVQQNIPESLRRTNCGVVIYDERVSRLPASIQTFLKDNYESSPEPEVFLRKGGTYAK